MLSIAGRLHPTRSRQELPPGALLIYQRQATATRHGCERQSVLGRSKRGLECGDFRVAAHGNALLSYRHDLNNAGITGGVTNGNSVNLAFNVRFGTFPTARYVEANLGGNSSLAGASGGPQWKSMLWLTVPIVLHP